MAISVVVTVGDVGDELVPAIEARLPKIKVGPGNEPESEMGPLITREHRDKVASYIDKATAAGATVVEDGRAAPIYTEDGFFLGVSLIDSMSGLTGTVGLLACLLRAKTTGQGCDVETCLYDVAMHQLTYPGVWYLNEGDVSPRVPRSEY